MFFWALRKSSWWAISSFFVFRHSIVARTFLIAFPQKWKRKEKVYFPRPLLAKLFLSKQAQKAVNFSGNDRHEGMLGFCESSRDMQKGYEDYQNYDIVKIKSVRCVCWQWRNHEKTTNFRAKVFALNRIHFYWLYGVFADRKNIFSTLAVQFIMEKEICERMSRPFYTSQHKNRQERLSISHTE